MGWWDKVKKVAGGTASTFVGAASLGTVNYNSSTGGIKASANPDNVANNYMESITGGKVVGAITGPAPKLPIAEDPALQARRAEAAANAKVAEQVGMKGKGLSSTILGGSISTDQSILKKRKLLGE